MRIKAKILSVLTPALLLTGIGSLGVAQASPANPAPNIPLCNHSGHGTCVDDRHHEGPGSVVQNKGFSRGQHGEWLSSGFTRMCGNGFVTLTCPFREHSIDHRYHNAQIIHLIFSGLSDHWCVGIISDQNTVVRNCRVGLGVNWVWVGNGRIVNVFATNNDGTPEFLVGNINHQDGVEGGRGTPPQAKWVYHH